MIIILPELWDFIELIHDKSLYEAKQTKQFLLLKNIFENEDVSIGIPSWSLFDGDDYVESIIYDIHSYTFNYQCKSFIFKNLPLAFFGIERIFNKLRNEHPNDLIIYENSMKATAVIKFLKENCNGSDDLSDILNNLKL